MVKNAGKRFEEDFKNSVPEEYFIYRLRDGTANFSGDKNENVRFQATNIADFIVMTNDKLLFLELKSYDSTCIPIKGIRENQLNGLCNINNPKVMGYFIFNFRKNERTYAVQAKKVKEFIENAERKSIPIIFAKDNGLEIPSEKKRTRFSYDLKEFLGR